MGYDAANGELIDLADYRLSRIQRNVVFTEVVAVGLDPADFVWQDHRGEYGHDVQTLRFLPMNAHLTIDYSTRAYGDGFWVEYSPRSVELDTRHGEWGTLLGDIRRWLRTVKAENDAPDLWATAAQERAWLTEPPSPTVNSPFTPIERELIARHLRTIETFASETYRLLPEQRAEVKAQLDYLEEATSRLGRFDWRGLAASTFIGIVLQLGLTPDRAQGLMNLATQLLGPLMSGAARLLAGGP